MSYGSAKANWTDKQHVRTQRSDLQRMKKFDAEEADDESFEDSEDDETESDDSESSTSSSVIDPTQMVFTGNPINLDGNPFTRF